MTKYFLSILSIIILLPFIGSSQDSILNKIDLNNLKQGHWVYLNKIKKLPDYQPEQKVEEGDYVDSKKNGTWTTYYNNDRIKHELTFQNNRPNGYATFYYKNGEKSEEGVWKNNRWVGDYKYYFESGQIAYDWKYNSSGKREGVQTYYHENGQVMIEGEWNGGKESGMLKEYYANGDVKYEKHFADGVIKEDLTKKFTRVNPEYVANSQPDPIQEVKPKDPVKAGVFDGNGNHTLKDRNGRTLRKGEFKDGFLVNGEVFQYDSNGQKLKTTVYKGGKIAEIINH
jgi:antitoxin component YwqK of YwqJK toxin-antitoxin module